MAYDNVTLELDGPVATLTLNRPEQLNAISGGLFDDLEAALRDLNDGDEIRVVRLRGAGRAFCAGYDLMPNQLPFYSPKRRRPDKRGESLGELGESRIAVDRESLSEGTDRWLRIWSYRKPMIAQVHGLCLSGALDLIGVCDIVCAGDDARFGHPAARGMGIPITLGMLPLRIGDQAAKELLFTGDLIDADEARQLGLVRRVYPADELDARTLEFCQRIALNSLDALTVHKHVTNRWAELGGVRMAVRECADFDAIFHEAPSMDRFAEVSRSEGLKAALKWRDERYRGSNVPPYKSNS
jgi:enoyl-CoA hydratase